MDNRSLVHEIITLNVTHRYRVGKAASSLGLYFGQPSILEFILQNNNCTQKELAEHLHISPASVATTLKRMEKSGFIERIEDKSDTRKKRLTVTEKGENVLLLYNGKTTTNRNAFTLAYGQIRLIDNDVTGKLSVLFLKML